MIAVIAGSVVGLLVLAATVILTAGGLFVPARYLDAWDLEYHEGFDDPRLQLVAHGILAPSGHNMQPWLVRLDPADPRVFDVFVDPGRLTPAVDPLARQTLVSTGTFLEYVRVAGARLGWAVDLQLFPDGEYDESDLPGSMAVRPAARVTLSPATPTRDADYESLFRSDTNRDPYGPEPLTTVQRAALRGLVTDPGVEFELLEGDDDRADLGDRAVRGTTIEAASVAAAEETAAVFRSNEWQKNDAPWGFAVEGQGTSGIMRYVMQGLLTLAPAINEGDAAAQRSIDLTTAEAAATPAYGIIRTAGNTRTEQIEAGMLYSRIELRARSLGLVMQPLSQVLQEYPEMAAEYAAVHERYAPGGETIQMLVRIGTPTRDYPVTMRRTVEDLLVG
jgi:hypothetical protein